MTRFPYSVVYSVRGGGIFVSAIAVRDIQAAIRKHALGEEVRLLVKRGSEPAGEIGVKHVSDYPET